MRPGPYKVQSISGPSQHFHQKQISRYVVHVVLRVSNTGGLPCMPVKAYPRLDRVGNVSHSSVDHGGVAAAANNMLA